MYSLLVLICVSTPTGGQICQNITRPDWVFRQETCIVEQPRRMMEVSDYFIDRIINVYPGSYISHIESQCIGWDAQLDQ